MGVRNSLKVIFHHCTYVVCIVSSSHHCQACTYSVDCFSQKEAQSFGLIDIKLWGMLGNCISLNGIPKDLASGHVIPTLLPPSEQLDSDSTHSHQDEDLNDASRKCSAKVNEPASSWREVPFTILHSTPILSI